MRKLLCNNLSYRPLSLYLSLWGESIETRFAQRLLVHHVQYCAILHFSSSTKTLVTELKGKQNLVPIWVTSTSSTPFFSKNFCFLRGSGNLVPCVQKNKNKKAFCIRDSSTHNFIYLYGLSEALTCYPDRKCLDNDLLYAPLPLPFNRINKWTAELSFRVLLREHTHTTHARARARTHWEWDWCTNTSCHSCNNNKNKPKNKSKWIHYFMAFKHRIWLPRCLHKTAIQVKQTLYREKGSGERGRQTDQQTDQTDGEKERASYVVY